MPLDKFVGLIKAGKDTGHRDAVRLLRATEALSSRIDSDSHNATTTESLNRLLPRLEKLLRFDFPTNDAHGRALLYAVLHSRNVRDADALTDTKVWGGPFTQIFGQVYKKVGDRNMWKSFLEKNPNIRASIGQQLHQEFPNDSDYVDDCIKSPSYRRYMSPVGTAQEQQIWERFLELTLSILRSALQQPS